jgi:hypothetical protein
MYDQGFDAPFSERLVELIILCIIILVALIGNISLWIIILSNHQLRTVSNWLVLCLSAADLMVSAINMPVTMFNLMVAKGLKGTTGCVVIGFLSMLTFVASVVSLASISWNRYMCICSPGKFKVVCTVRKTLSVIAGDYMLTSSYGLSDGITFRQSKVQMFKF